MSETTGWAELALYAPAAGYLLVVSALLWASGKVPHWVHLCAVAVGTPLRILQSGWVEPAATLAAAGFVFIGLVAFASRTVTGVSLFTIAATLALSPLQGWPGVVVGLVVSAAVAGWRTWRTLGKERVLWLTSDTLAAMGLSPAGGFQRPDLSLMPEREALTDVHANSEKAARMRMFVPPWLLLGVSLSALVAAVAS